jgi:hypothetical protein
MRDIRLVEQTSDYNCGAAALAMILGLSDPGKVERDYLRRECSTSHADRGVVPEQIGVLIDEAQRVLFEAGIPALSYVDLDRCMAAGAWVCRVWTGSGYAATTSFVSTPRAALLCWCAVA